MTTTNRDRTYYRTSEACRIAGISRSTLLRWFKSGTLKDITHRDRRGWRLFTQTDTERIRHEADKQSKQLSPLGNDRRQTMVVQTVSRHYDKGTRRKNENAYQGIG